MISEMRKTWMKSRNPNGIYYITRNFTEFAKLLMNKSKVGQYIINQSAIWTSVWILLYYLNIKYYLNMNPACFACPCVNEWRRFTLSFTKQILKPVMLAVFSASTSSIYEYMNRYSKHNL